VIAGSRQRDAGRLPLIIVCGRRSQIGRTERRSRGGGAAESVIVDGLFAEDRGSIEREISARFGQSVHVTGDVLRAIHISDSALLSVASKAVARSPVI